MSDDEYSVSLGIVCVPWVSVAHFRVHATDMARLMAMAERERATQPDSSDKYDPESDQKWANEYTTGPRYMAAMTVCGLPVMGPASVGKTLCEACLEGASEAARSAMSLLADRRV